jgi:hypothetical protein
MVKEVATMQAQVRAIPEMDSWVVECTEHGLLGVATDETVDRFAVNHMADAHGAAKIAQ